MTLEPNRRMSADENALVGMMYELAVDPAAFERLLSLSASLVCATDVPLDVGQSLSRDVAEHAERADAILARLDTGDTPPPTAVSVMEMLRAEPSPAVVLSWDGRVLGANTAFAQQFNAKTPGAVKKTLSDVAYGDEWDRVLQRLAQNEGTEGLCGVVQVAGPEGRRLLFLLHHARSLRA